MKADGRRARDREAKRAAAEALKLKKRQENLEARRKWREQGPVDDGYEARQGVTLADLDDKKEKATTTIFSCAACKKTFKSEKQYANHCLSKAHKKKATAPPPPPPRSSRRLLRRGFFSATLKMRPSPASRGGVEDVEPLAPPESCSPRPPPMATTRRRRTRPMVILSTPSRRRRPTTSNPRRRRRLGGAGAGARRAAAGAQGPPAQGQGQVRSGTAAAAAAPAEEEEE